MDNPVVIAFIAILGLIGVMYAVKADSGHSGVRALIMAVCCVAIAYCSVFALTQLANASEFLDDPVRVVAVSVGAGLVAGALLVESTGILPLRALARRWVIPTVTAPPALAPWIARLSDWWWSTTPLATRWFDNASDLSTLRLTNRDLDAFRRAALRKGREKLSDDVVAGLRVLQLKGPERQAQFWIWSDRARNGGLTTVKDDTTVSAQIGTGPVEHALPQPWRDDPSWRDLVILSGPTAQTAWTALIHPYGKRVKGWSTWQMQLAPQAPGPPNPTYYGLHNGVFEECPPDVRQTGW